MCFGDRKTGRVKFFNARKGYGFIIPTGTTMERSQRSSQSAVPSICNNKTSVKNDQTSNHEQDDDQVEGML